MRGTDTGGPYLTGDTVKDPPRISSAHILMDGMTHIMRLCALVADMMTVDQVDERMDSEVVGGGCHRGRAI